MSPCRLLFVALLACLIPVACAQTPKIDIQAEVEQIRQLSEAWQQAVEVRDIDACTTFYAPDGMEMLATGLIVEGREAIYEWYADWILDTNITYTFQSEVIEVAASGDLAYERGMWQTHMEWPDGPLDDVGKYVVVWKKIAGEWKVTIHISISDVPLVDPW